MGVYKKHFAELEKCFVAVLYFCGGIAAVCGNLLFTVVLLGVAVYLDMCRGRTRE